MLVESWRAAYTGIIADEYLAALSVDAQEQRWRKRLQGPQPPIVLVACDDKESIVGFVAGGAIRQAHDDFDGELYAIYLVPAVQRRRLGRRLLVEWAALATSSGFRSALVRVLSANPARAFYERSGARLLREASIELGGVVYPETWYGWPALDTVTVLTTS